MSISSISYEQIENPSKTKLKLQYLHQYRMKLGLSSNHKEQIPQPKYQFKNISIKQLDQLLKPEISRAKVVPENQKVLTAQLLHKITQKQYEQEFICKFPTIPNPQKKKRSKTEQHQKVDSKEYRKLAKTAYLIIL